MDTSIELIATLHDPVKLHGPHDIEVKDGLAFVAGKFGSFAIVDVKDPEKPQIVSAFIKYMDECETVLLHEGLCYVGTHEFVTIDYEDPEHPEILSRISDETIHAINGMAVWGSHVIAASKGGFVNVFEAERPRSPRLLGSIATKENGELQSPHDVAVSGNLVMVADQRGKSAHKVGIYRAVDGKHPMNWPLLSLIDGDELDGANRLIVDSSYLYVANNKASTIAVLDIDDPANPEVLALVPTAGTAPDGIELVGDTLFVGAEDRVEVLDVSEPANPRWISQDRYPDLFPKEGRGAHDLCCVDDLLYVTAQQENRIGIFRIT